MNFFGAALEGVKRMLFAQALRASTTHRYDYLHTYVGDLESVIDMAAIRDSKITLGVDPLGGAGIDYWPLIAERYGLNLTVVNESVDPTFRFMTVDWDGKIRMDPSSPYAMQKTDRTERQIRHCVCQRYRPRPARHRDQGKRLAASEPLSFGLHPLLVCESGELGQRRRRRENRSEQQHDRSRQRTAADAGCTRCRSASSGLSKACWLAGWASRAKRARAASFLRRDGSVWTTDKDGIIPCLLSAEITARLGRDPGEIYRELTRDLGDPVYERIDAPATPEQKAALEKLSPADIHVTEVAGEKVQQILTAAPGDGNADWRN